MEFQECYKIENLGIQLIILKILQNSRKFTECHKFYKIPEFYRISGILQN